jgi:ribose transport system substrate-binding protein
MFNEIKKVLFFVLVITVFIFSINSTSASEKFVVGIACHAAGNEFNNYLIEELQKKLNELGVEYNYVIADGTFEGHNNNIETLIGKGLKVIVVVGGGVDALKPVQDLAASKGAILISADVGLTGPGVLTDVTSDNRLIGQLSAYYLVSKLDGEGEIVVINQPYYGPTEIRWIEGAKTVFDQYPKIKIVGETAIQYPEGTPQARAAMESHLIAHPEIKGVWAVYDQPALGAVLALLDADRKDVIVVAADGDKVNVVDYIAEGLIQRATVAQDSGIMGRTCAEVAVQYLKGEKTDFPEYSYAPVTLVVKGNALSFAKKRGYID